MPLRDLKADEEVIYTPEFLAEQAPDISLSKTAVPETQTAGPIPGQPGVPFLADRPTSEGAQRLFNAALSLGMSEVGPIVGRTVKRMVPEPQTENPQERQTLETFGNVLGGAADVATQFLGPGLVARGGQAVAKGLAKVLPGSQAARTELGIDAMRNLMKDLYGKAMTKHEVAAQEFTDFPSQKIEVPNLTHALNKLIAQESAASAGAADTEILRSAQSLRDKILATGVSVIPLGTGGGISNAATVNQKITELKRNLASQPQWRKSEITNEIERLEKQLNISPSGGGGYRFSDKPILDLKEAATELSGIGENVGALKSQGKRVHGGFSELFAAFAKDLERVPGGKAILDKNKAYRQMKGLEDLDNIIEKVVSTKRGTGTEDIQAGKVIDQLRRNEYLRDSFSPSDLKEIETLLDKLVKLPAIPAPKGVAVGSGRLLAPGVTIGGVEQMMGGPGIATGAAFALSGLMELSRILLPSPRGRAVLKKVLESGPINQTKWNVLTATVRGITGQNIPPLREQNK